MSHLGISFSAWCCTVGKQGWWRTFLFCLLTPSRSCLRIFITLCSRVQVASPQYGGRHVWRCRRPDWRARMRLKVRRAGREGEYERWMLWLGRRASICSPPVQQKPLYFLPWNKSAFRLQTESWAWVLINIGHVSFHDSSDGLFSTFLLPHKCWQKGTFRGSLCYTWFELLMGQLSVQVCMFACVRVHAPKS